MEIKKQKMYFVVAIHHRDDYDAPNSEDEATIQDIEDLNIAMVAAGVRHFVGGLQRCHHAKSIRQRGDGEFVVTDGPYLETKEHMGGFWVLDVESEEEAIEWGKKATRACRVPVEIRQIFLSRRERNPK